MDFGSFGIYLLTRPRKSHDFAKENEVNLAIEIGR